MLLVVLCLPKADVHSRGNGIYVWVYMCVSAVSGMPHKFDCDCKEFPQSSPQANQKAVHHLSPAKGVSSLSYAD